MKPDLRDWFAAHVAAALAAEQRLGMRAIAARAYDVADALMVERGDRLDAELAAARDEEAAGVAASPGLLDEAVPWDDDTEEADPGQMDAPGSREDRPGLARTQLELPLIRDTGS